MTKNLQCAKDDAFLKLDAQTVACPKCKESGRLEAANLTISAQADEAGKRLDVKSIKADKDGRLTFEFLPRRKPRVTNRAQSA